MIFPIELIEQLQSAKHIAVLTGAGISAESGIPTFRDAQADLWSHYAPEALASPQAFGENPRLVWDWYLWRKQLISKAHPNVAHLALADLAENTPEMTLITQNIDGLHQAAGIQKVVELHGNIYRAKCVNEDRLIDGWEITGTLLPLCPFCGSLLRPDVVWFGEQLPTHTLQQAMKAVNHCDLLLVIGTSGIVQPAASLPIITVKRGKPCVEINPEPTPLTPSMTYHFRGFAGIILPALVKATWP